MFLARVIATYIMSRLSSIVLLFSVSTSFSKMVPVSFSLDSFSRNASRYGISLVYWLSAHWIHISLCVKLDLRFVSAYGYITTLNSSPFALWMVMMLTQSRSPVIWTASLLFFFSQNSRKSLIPALWRDCHSWTMFMKYCRNTSSRMLKLLDLQIWTQVS